MPGSGRHGQLDLLQPGVEAVLAAGEPGGHRRHGDLLGLVPGQGGSEDRGIGVVVLTSSAAGRTPAPCWGRHTPPPW